MRRQDKRENNDMSERDEIRRLGVAIRKKCLDCSGGMVSEVKGCRIKDCPLWPYRTADGEKREPKRAKGQIDIFHLEGTA